MGYLNSEIDIFEKWNVGRICLWGINITILLYLLMLGFYNFFSCDDLLLFSQLDSLGLVGFVKDYYFNYMGRFGAMTITALAMKLVVLGGHQILLTIYLLLLGIYSIYLILGLVNINIKREIRLLISMFLFNFYVLGSFEFSTFYWTCASGYFTLTFLTFFLIYFLFNSKENFFVYACIFISSYFVGGGGEHYTCFVIFFLGLYLLYFLRKVQYSFKELWLRRRKAIIALLLLCIGFLVMLCAPGNLNRMQALNISRSPLHIFIASFEGYVQFLILYISKLWYVFLIAPIFLYIGSFLFEKKIKLPIFHNKQFLFSIILLLFTYWLFLLPGAYAIGGMAPPRALTYIVSINLVFFSFWGIVLGYKYHNFCLYRKLFVLSSFLIMLVIIFQSVLDVPAVKKYYDQNQERYKYLLELEEKGEKGLIEVKPLEMHSYQTLTTIFYNKIWLKVKTKPAPEVSYFPFISNEISEDPSYFTNVGLREYLNLDFDVVLNSQLETNKCDN